MMGNIIWLASYPKSGNTWFRIFISNLLGEDDNPADINKITSTNGIASSRTIFDERCGVEASDLSFDEIDNLRPDLYQLISDEATSTNFIKVHDAYTLLADKSPLFPTTATKGVIYIIRNPLDVAVSYAAHVGISLHESVQQMGKSTNMFSKSEKKLSSQLRQKLLTWSDHVSSWTKAADTNVHIVRYEDMKLNPLETFENAMKFSGFNFEKEVILNAVENSSFEKLQLQEKESGFKEKSSHTDLFFRKGQVGAWREVLSEELVSKIIKDHNSVMKEYNYLTTTGDIVF